MTRGVCAECAEGHSLLSSLFPKRVMDGPKGRKLCRKHHREAWVDHMGEKRNNRG